jgi:predicted glutamine amidotransferase
MVRSSQPDVIKPLLSDFAQMCQKSRTADGDWQGDGWGIAWQNSQAEWESYKSLKPIWEDHEQLLATPAAQTIVVHARSASFASHKGVIEYNQPYSSNQACFVFNGSIRGVRLSMPLAGTIGAQKIYSLLESLLARHNPKTALQKLAKLLTKKSAAIEGMNIGIAINNKFYAMCQHSTNHSYFTLRTCSTAELTLVCSEPLGGTNWNSMQNGEVIEI